MPKVIITAQVDNGSKWETNFRTHSEMFKSYGLTAPVSYAIRGDEATVCMEPSDVDAFMNHVSSQATIDAMSFDGVKPETVKVVILDGELRV